jgi:hypothetical protein
LPRLAGFQKIKDFLQVAEQGLNRKSLQDFPKFFLSEKTLEVPLEPFGLFKPDVKFNF